VGLPQPHRWRIIVITKEHCPACEDLLAALEKVQLPFEKYDTESLEASLLFQKFQLARGYPILLLLVNEKLYFTSYGFRSGLASELARLLRGEAV